MFINNIFSENFVNSGVKQEKPKSLRYQNEEDDQFNNLNVTPEFQNFVAKRLSKFLEEQLTSRMHNSPYVKKKKRKRFKTGVRLFRNSKDYLDVTEVENEINVQLSNVTKPTITKRNCDPDLNNESNKICEAAVSPEDILSKKEVQHWSNRSKAPVFRYKKTSSGELQYIEPEFR